MVNKTKSTNVEPHDLWLAGLGVVALTRKQVAKAYDVLVKEGSQFRKDANKRIDMLTTQARDSFDEVKGKVEATVEPALIRANEAYGVVKHEVEARLAPVVDLFDADKNVTQKTKPAVRKSPATKKASAPKKKAAAKTVKKAAPRAGTKKAA